MRGVIRTTLVTSKYPWLKENVVAGTIVHKFLNTTYGVISDNGVAVSKHGAMEYPFFEVPSESVEWFNEP